MRIFLSVLAIMVIFSANGAFGFGNVQDNDVIDGDKNHHNTIVNGDVSNGADTVVNKNKNQNHNSNRNTNLNCNRNTNIQGQGQKQGQMQGQGQLQGQSQEANNEGNHQTLNQKFEDKRNLIDSTYIPGDGASVTNHGNVNAIKIQGSLWMRLDSITKKQAVHASKGASDIDIEYALLFENDFQVTRINKGEPKGATFMGYIYVLPSGMDCTLAQMEAKALKEAMYAGANFAVLEYGAGKYLEGSSWSIGVGGGASMFANGDSVAIAPNGGFGYGKAYSNNEMRPSIVVALYILPELIVEKIEKNVDRYEIAR